MTLTHSDMQHIIDYSRRHRVRGPRICCEHVRFRRGPAPGCMAQCVFQECGHSWKEYAMVPSP